MLVRLYAKSACPEACLVLHNKGLPDNCIVPVWDWAYFYPCQSLSSLSWLNLELSLEAAARHLRAEYGDMYRQVFLFHLHTWTRG